MKSRDYSAAEKYARLANTSHMDGGLAAEYLAQALYGEGKDKEALNVYAQLPPTLNNEWPYALLLLKSGHWAQAVTAYNLALETSANAAVMLGGDTKLLRQATTFTPDHPQQQSLKAAILIGWATTLAGGSFDDSYLNAVRQAQPMYAQALSLAPNSAIANYYYGYGLQRIGRRAEAQAAFAKAEELDKSGEVKAAIERL